MPYSNDVFISYKRGRINEQWLNDIFLPIFTEYLDNSLDFSPKIFVDTKGLAPGVFFNEDLFINLVQSKCIVSIWSPPYFRKSDWCIIEFLTMKYRQETLKLGPLTKPKSLIWPVLYREINPMPDIAAGLQYVDYRDFNVVGDAFFRTEMYLEFQEKMQDDIKTVVDIIKNVPVFNAALETEEGLKKLKDELKVYFNANNKGDDPQQPPISWEI